jgi:hypothetical protein
MRIYQVLNGGGYPAEYKTFNPKAIFTTKKECKEFIAYLKENCGLEKEKFTINRIL